MCILIDFNQVLISNLMSHVNSNRGEEISEDLLRHMVLSSLLFYRKKFGNEYNELILCADDKNYWRKKVFEYYKGSRKKTREESVHDWQLIFSILNKIRDEVKENFPYKVLRIPHAEADDIIATLCKYFHTEEFTQVGLFEEPQPIMIVSSDKDFMQLQKYHNVRQYSPMQRKFLKTDDPLGFLKEHVLRGDRGDGVPNVLSADSSLIDSTKRQKQLRAKKYQELFDGAPGDYPEEIYRNWKRNDQIINLDNVPEDIERQILEAYSEPVKGKKNKLMGYFIKNRLKFLIQHIQDF